MSFCTFVLDLAVGWRQQGSRKVRHHAIKRQRPRTQWRIQDLEKGVSICSGVRQGVCERLQRDGDIVRSAKKIVIARA